MTLRQKRLATMLQTGASLRACSRALHMSKPALRSLISDLGLTLPPEDAQSVASNPRRGAGHEPLPSGHPLSWGILPRLASLEGGV